MVLDQDRVTRKIKVIYAYVGFYRASGGEMHPLVLAKHLDRTKFDFAICVIENARSDRRVAIEHAGCPIYDLNLSRRFYNVCNMMRVIYGFYRTFKRTKPDIVQTQAMHANLLARPAAILAGVPIVISTDNSLPDIETHAIKRLLNAPLHCFNNLLDRATARRVVVSEDLRRRKTPKRGLSNIHVIPPPFDLDAFHAARASLPACHSFVDIKRPVIGVIGRLSREKGHHYLIAAMPEMLAYAPETQLFLVGAGPAESELRAQVERLSLTHNVTFVGYKRNVYAELARMDILFVPSLSEAYPVVILEGMAMGLPVVGTRVGGIPEVIADGETGILVPPRDASALAQAFKYLLSHPQQGRRMGQQGKEKVLSVFHPSRFIADHERLYENAVAMSCAKVG